MREINKNDFCDALLIAEDFIKAQIGYKGVLEWPIEKRIRQLKKVIEEFEEQNEPE